MKVLDFEAVRAIAAETPDSELIRWVDEALREKSGYTLPPKIHIAQQDGDYYNVMPCIYERGNIAMVKMIGRHSIKRGEDRSSMMGDILLYESDTGILRALMDGEYITTLRTGISAAHSARLFTRPDFETVGPHRPGDHHDRLHPGVYRLSAGGGGPPGRDAEAHPLPRPPAAHHGPVPGGPQRAFCPVRHL